MANNQTEVNEAEYELETAERGYWVEQKQALDRLEKNADFQLVVLEGYFKDRALDGVSMLGTDYVKQSGKRGDVMEILVAISTLQDHFITVKNLGGIAEDDELALNGPQVD